jgi:hypothetical protein
VVCHIPKQSSHADLLNADLLREMKALQWLWLLHEQIEQALQQRQTASISLHSIQTC